MDYTGGYRLARLGEKHRSSLCVSLCMSVTSSERIEGNIRLSVKEHAHPQNQEVTGQVPGREMKPVWQELARVREAWPDRVKS